MWKTSELIGYGIRARDGAIGSVADLLFDDARWELRWAVVDTGTWLPGRQVLLPASGLGQPDLAAREIPVEATRAQVKESPGIETDAPLSRQLESRIYGYYGWTPYWAGGFGYPLDAPGVFTGAAAVPPPAGVQETSPDAVPASDEPPGDPHLRSVDEVAGYYVEASDGSIGHIDDLLIEREVGWAVRYLIVDTRNWWPGRQVLISPRWLREISWADQQVFLDVTRDQVRNSPEYRPETLDRAAEERLHGHYGYPPYWL